MDFGSRYVAVGLRSHEPMSATADHLSWLPVQFSPYAMGRDSQRYPEPLKVDPSRWIPFTQPSPYEFPVFQAGPRMCLGVNMALLEAKCLITMILQVSTSRGLETRMVRNMGFFLTPPKCRTFMCPWLNPQGISPTAS